VGLPWYPKYPRDFLASPFVAQLSYEEIGIYNTLLDRAWLDPHCSIPADREQLANLVRGAAPEAVERVLTKWVPSPDIEGRLINETLYAHWKRSQDKSHKARRAVETRWARERERPKEKKRVPKGVTAAEFAKIDEMVETWNAEALPGLQRAQYAAQAPEQAKKMAARIRSKPWLHTDFQHIVQAAMNKYGNMIAKGEANFLRFIWFATGPLATMEALRDAPPLLATKGAPSRL